MSSIGALPDAIAAAGWAMTGPVVPESEIEALIAALARLQTEHATRGGLRNLFGVTAVRSLAQSLAVRDVAEAVLGPTCIAVKATLFDKTPAANWRVAWHQDVTIALRERRVVPGFDPWTEKEGVPHAQAPADVLEQMLAVRVHLDECGADNGPLRVLPGSHRGGRLDASAIDARVAAVEPVSCIAERGSILAFRPLLLHASSPATLPAHRRVIHFEFARQNALPTSLAWRDEVRQSLTSGDQSSIISGRLSDI